MIVHFVLPNDIDDPARPSGGNRYDRRLSQALAAAGWSVVEHAVAGDWPRAGEDGRARLATVLAALPAGATVLIDGLIGSAVAHLLAGQSGRLRLLVLLHMPVDDADERAALSAAAGVITTSQWSRQLVIDRYGLPGRRVWAAPPGVDLGPIGGRSAGGGRLLCVAAVAPHKGHDLLVTALSRLGDEDWRLVCVGALDRDEDFAGQVLRQAQSYPRVSFVGPLTGPDLEERFATADLLVAPSRVESYGMAVSEALARGLPVLAADVGGLPEALGHAPDGTRPGVLVPPADAAALAAALRDWLADPGRRDRLTRSAVMRRMTLKDWAATAKLVATALIAVSEAKAGVGG